MIKFYKLILLVSLIIVGCKTKEIGNNKIRQSINNFNMNIFNEEGKKLVLITSPYSSFDKDKNSFFLNDTTINIFKDNKIDYIINSDKSKLTNNKLLELNGNVLVNTLVQEGDRLYANSFLWNMQNSEYLLVGNVKFENNSIILSSNKAILNKADNIIEFFNPVKYKIKNSKNESGYEINSENAYYNIDTKSLKFKSKEARVRSKIYF